MDLRAHALKESSISALHSGGHVAATAAAGTLLVRETKLARARPCACGGEGRFSPAPAINSHAKPVPSSCCCCVRAPSEAAAHR